MKRYTDYTKIESMAKIPSNGVFWVIDDELYAFPFTEENMVYDGVAKSGTTYNHKKLWNYVKPKKCNKPFDYYPRGRVDINSKGKATIYMNPNISMNIVPQIKVEFGLREEPRVIYDNSEHYKCYLDNEI